MAKSSTINMRVDGKLKADAERIFKKLGLSTTEAIKIFLSAVRNKQGIPFPVQLDEKQEPVAPEPTDRNAVAAALRGKYKKMSSSEEFAHRKQEEIDFEERRLRQ
jgi:addiction module RelB/DinJ family antitoxin